MTLHERYGELGDRLAERWVDFGRLLRRNGVNCTAGQMRDLLRALPEIDLADREVVYFASRALLCSRREDMPKFDLTFRQFWGRTRQLIIPSDTGSMNDQQAPTSPPKGPMNAPVQKDRTDALPVIEKATLGEGEDGPGDQPLSEEDIQQALLYSAQERLRNLDFARFTDEEITMARSLLASWDWEPGERRTRRLAPAKRGRKLDFGRTLRRAMRTAGVPFSLSTKGPRKKPRRLVLICDISGSMAPYTRMLLHFLHTLERGNLRAEVFVFGTRLTRITRQLRLRDVDQALAEVGKSVVDWSGGTRMGEALREFNTRWARRVMGQGAVVCLISDGWDRGDPQALAVEMAFLQRISFRLIWLNPLLGMAGYRPLTRGMIAALPFVDDFLPANNLASLQALAILLSTIDVQQRPERRQVLRPTVEETPKPRLAAQAGLKSVS